MRFNMCILLFTIAAGAGIAAAQDGSRNPRIGYVYPAGGAQGATFDVTVGGQYLRGARQAYVSGAGVQAEVLQHCPPLRNLEAEQRRALQRTLRTLLAERQRDAAGSTVTSEDLNKLPAHPLLRDLLHKNLRQLRHIQYELQRGRKQQPNSQIAESVVLRIAISPTAEPGDREIRLQTPLGLSNPMRLQVGLASEVCELEPNGPFDESVHDKIPPLELPVLLNGQIRPGDIDRFRFHAEAGQRLVIDVDARYLIPYLADAVPGWFQAVVTLYDDVGREVAFNDDYRFDPDPVLLFEVTRRGDYILEIRDAIYRGREDFVYRILVGEAPFITQAFPLGAPLGRRSITAVEGWNLRSRQLVLDTGGEGERIRQTAWQRHDQRSNPVAYAVDDLPVSKEAEPNNTSAQAQRIALPRAINGRIDPAGDVDVFRFKASAGAEVVAEIFGRRLLSPLDGLLYLTDEAGEVLAWNDDHDDLESGLCTHHADAYLRARLPETGYYCIQVRDAQRHGGPAYAYRLRLEPPRPDFALRATPSSINVRAGSATVLDIHAVRKDGFAGDILVALKDAPTGFFLSGQRIPAGRDRIRMTLSAPSASQGTPVELHLEGRAVINEHTVRRRVTAAEDMMQAFLYRHLAPAQQLLVDVLGRRGGPPVRYIGDGPIRLPAGGTATVRFQLPTARRSPDIEFQLNAPPEGVTLERVNLEADGLTLHLRADAARAQVGCADNLIVDAIVPANTGAQGGKGRRKGRTRHLGVLPAVPIEIAAP